MKLRPIFCLSLAIALAAFLAGCDLHPGTLNSIQVSPSAASAAQPGTVVQFTATALYTHGPDAPTTKDVTAQVTWASSTATVATVDASGVATAVGAGTTSITATMSASHGPVSGVASMDVTTTGTRTLTSVAIIPGAQSLNTLGETAQFIAIGTYNAAPTTENLAAQVSWVTSDPSVAAVDSSSGVATAVGCGTSVALQP